MKTIPWNNEKFERISFLLPNYLIHSCLRSCFVFVLAMPQLAMPQSYQFYSIWDTQYCWQWFFEDRFIFKIEEIVFWICLDLYLITSKFSFNLNPSLLLLQSVCVVQTNNTHLISLFKPIRQTLQLLVMNLWDFGYLIDTGDYMEPFWSTHV